MTKVLAFYEEQLRLKGFKSDPAQLRAVQALERCANEWAQSESQRGSWVKSSLEKPNVPQGVYLYGGVGRGKSFLMDCFFACVPVQEKDSAAFS
jgi:cell division protein ZapE